VIRKHIVNGIRLYAEAYSVFQKLQDDNPELLAVGDQKTGVIGEFFGLLYAQSIYPSAKVGYAADPSQTGWDLEVSSDECGPDIKIQVKTVSGYSKTRTITPLFPGWDHLYLMYLGRNLMPEGFWIVTNNDIFRGRFSLTGLTMRKPTNPQSGSVSIPWGEDRVEELMRLVEQHLAEPDAAPDTGRDVGSPGS
jgi:hypothetical protein